MISLQSDLALRSRTKDGKEGVRRLTNKIFVHHMWSKSVLGIYISALAVLKEYVCLFQSDECKVHMLHDSQMNVFKRFLAMFVKPQVFSRLGPEQITDAKRLSANAEENLLSLHEMHTGSYAQKELSALRAKDRLVLLFLETAQKGFIGCGEYLKRKLPINNVLKSMAALDPESEHCHNSVQKCLKELSAIASNILNLTPEEALERSNADELEAKEREKNDLYCQQVDMFCTSQNLLPGRVKDKPAEVDEWWAAVKKTGKYQLLYSKASALLTCFHGPKVESSFNLMGDIMDKRSSRQTRQVGCFSDSEICSQGQQEVCCAVICQKRQVAHTCQHKPVQADERSSCKTCGTAKEAAGRKRGQASCTFYEKTGHTQ